MCRHNSKNMKSTCIPLLPSVNLTQYKNDKQKFDHKNRQECSRPFEYPPQNVFYT